MNPEVYGDIQEWLQHSRVVDTTSTIGGDGLLFISLRDRRSAGSGCLGTEGYLMNGQRLFGVNALLRLLESLMSPTCASTFWFSSEDDAELAIPGMGRSRTSE